MAAGGSSKASAGALEATLDRKLQAVSNTMESIQNLSSWCIENKKHHSTIVHYWLKWLRRSSISHRLNLFYLANDVIQNCKRKNAIVFRETFSDVMPEAASLVRDQSVMKSVERIFKIWEERNVYSEDTVASFRSGLSGAWGKREKSERSRSARAKVPEKVQEAVATNSKAALKSKIVAEFRPQKLIDDLTSHKRSVDHVDLKEKQLSNMRVDVCSTETLKRLKDKAGGKKFSKDFEEASAKLEEFVNILDKQVKSGPSLTDALENAGIFYEAQYKEVKIVVNAYKTFANRVNNLKKRLDQLKATLPDPEESPMPSPTIDAPSPTGSESPFQGMGGESPLSPEPEPIPAVSPEPPKDNRDVEDMELSDVDADEEMPHIIVEERKETPTHSAPSLKVVNSVTEASKTIPDSANTPSVAPRAQTPAPVPTTTTTASVLVTTSTPVSTSLPTAQTVPAKTVTTPTVAPSIPLALPILPNVDLGKISSILSSLTSVMKNTGVSPAAKPSPGTPTTPTTNLGGGLKPSAPGSSNPLANILSKVEITPESILSVLSKTQVTSAPSLQGFSSFIQSVAMSSGSITHGTSTAPVNTGVSTVKDRSITPVTPSAPKTFSYSTPSSNSVTSSSLPVTKTTVSHGSKPQVNAMAFSSQPPMAAEKSVTQLPQSSKSSDVNEPSSLEMKIHNFLKGNPGFSGLDLNIPILTSVGSNVVPEPAPEFHRGPSSTSLDNVDGTPVRDERSGTPTQDEMMDKPSSSNVDTVSLLSKIISPDSSTPSSTRSPLNKEGDFQKLATMPVYRSFGLGGNSPNAYRQPGDGLEKTLQLDSSLGKFYPSTVFPEDEDYRDFDFSGPPPSAIGSLEKGPSKSVLKPNIHLESSEYQSMPPGFSQNQDYGRQSFPQSMHGPFHSGDGSGPSPPAAELYGNRNIRRGNKDVNKTPSPKKEESFFPPDNHNLSVAHPVMSQSLYTNSPHPLQNRPHNFAPKNNLPSGCAPVTNVEQPGSSVSASSMMEFKNMLKNASHRPSDENKYGQEDVAGPGRTGTASDDRPHQEEHYRIETRVSSSCANLSDGTEEKGAPIETLGYHSVGNMRLSGEPIKIVESVRVGVKGNRGHGIDGSRGGWYEMGSTGSSFDDGPSSSADDPSSIGGSGGFKTQYEEHLQRFPETSDFRAKNMLPPFEHHLPPPPMVAPLDHGGAFQMERPPPGPPPPDHGGLFGRDIPIAARMSSVEPPNHLSHGAHPPPAEHVNPFPGHLPPEHGSIPFSPPPHLDMRNPFTQDHGTVHQGAMKEHYGAHPTSSRDHGPLSHDHNGPPHGRVNEAMAPNSRDHHGPHSGPPHHFVPSHRDNMNPGGLRPQRQQFRPREPFNSLKRPRPPFGRGPQFFSPKRPFYPPRY